MSVVLLLADSAQFYSSDFIVPAGILMGNVAAILQRFAAPKAGGRDW